jgi:uncharacterized YccA/Bax inhibitor family protein
MAQTTMTRSLERNFGRLTEAYPLTPEAERFTAAGVYDKLAGLVVLALVAAAAGYLVATPGVVLVAIFAALGAYMIGLFRPAWARITAPVYALLEGFALGAISGWYAQIAGGIVPLAILFTGAVFVAALVAFRTGLVKVTPKFVSITLMATFGLFIVYLAALFGLRLPGVDELGPRGVIFGVIGLGIGVMNLFVDFQYVQTSEERGVSADGEWFGAQIMMASLVLVYINVLRILASAYGRRR